MIDILKSILMPSQLAVLLILSGMLLQLMGKARRMKIAILSAGVAIHILFSFGPVATLMISPLEYKYPALRSVEDYPDVNQIVVLAAYSSADATMPQSSWPSGSAMIRLVEALHIYSARPETTIFVSGAQRDVEILVGQLETFGIPPQQIVANDNSTHTINSAESLGRIMADEPFFLVTSAGHMPRAVTAFVHQGMRPIPAPTDYQLPDDPRKASLTLSPKHLYISDLAIREYGGIAWYYLADKLRLSPNSMPKT